MKNINFRRVAIKNFLSVGDEPVVVEFFEGLHILTGNNKDKPERKNAVGKSTIADAIYFSIFGETLREIKKDLIVNNVTNGKTHVELDFDVDSPRGKNSFKIIRTLSPTKVFVYKDGVDRTRDSIANTTKYICDVLSASPSIFQNCVIMTVNNAVPFMAKNKVEKRKFIEDIFGLEVFSKMMSHLRSEYNESKRQYDIEQGKIAELQKSLANFSTEKEKALERKKEKKVLYSNRYRENEEELIQLKDKISKIPEIDISSINKDIVKLQDKIINCDSKLHELLELCSSSRTNIEHKKANYLKIGTEEDTCPICLRSLQEHDKERISSEKKLLKEEIEKLAEDVKQCGVNIENFKKAKKKLNEILDKKKKEVSSAQLHQQNIKNQQDRIAQLQKWQLELNQDLLVLNDDTSEFDTLIQETNTRLSDLEKLTESISRIISNLDIVKYIISEEGVKSYIVNKLLDLLNSRLAFYLKKLDVNFVCLFNEFFEEEIYNENNKVCSYFNFSGAERKSIDLACLFTFSDIRRMQGGVTYNIAIYDELFDSSFDEKGIENITEILKERVDDLKECSIVISHRKESLKAVTGDIIFLEKEDGITRRVEYSDF